MFYTKEEMLNIKINRFFDGLCKVLLAVATVAVFGFMFVLFS